MSFSLSLWSVYLGSKSSYVFIFRIRLQVTSYSIVAPCLSDFTCSDHLYLLPVPESSTVSFFLEADSHAIVCIEPIFFTHSWVLVRLGCSRFLPLETGLAGMAWVPLSLKMFLLPVCVPRHVISVSWGTSMFHFLKLLRIVLSSGRTNGDCE